MTESPSSGSSTMALLSLSTGSGNASGVNWHNPAMSWSELEARMSGRVRPELDRNGDPIPPWIRRDHRPGAQALPDDVVPYAELHCHSNFSFLDGASDPEDS